MIVEKLDNFKIKGHVKVSLFEKGKLVQEVEKDNFITQFGEEYLRVINARNVGGGLGTVSDSLNWYGTSDNRGATTFNKLLLSDSDIPENPLKDKFLWGSNIGWADRIGAYSGADIRRGSINLSESYTSGDRVHLVFDFPTHSANGIIKSLGFVNNSEGIEGMYMKLKEFGGRHDTYSVATKGRYAYCVIYNARFFIKINLDDFTYEQFDYTHAIYGIANLNGSMYVSTGREIFKLSVDEKVITTEKLMLGVVFANTVKICSLKNKLYLITADTGLDDVQGKSKRELLYVFDSMGTLLERVDLPFIANASNYINPISEDVLHMQGYVFNINTKEFVACNGSYNFSIYDEELDKNYWLTNGYVNKLYPSTLATKVVLPTPIEKTDKKTMKIEYDFIY